MNKLEVQTPQATIIGNAAYLVKNFERVENGWIAYKIFNSSYPAPKSWRIEAGSTITEDGLDIDPGETCSWGINVAKDIGWIQDFISNEEEDCNGKTVADVWKVFIPDTAMIVIPEDTDGKIRTNIINLLSVIAEAHYLGNGYDFYDEEEDQDYWEDDDYPPDDYDDGFDEDEPITQE